MLLSDCHRLHQWLRIIGNDTGRRAIDPQAMIPAEWVLAVTDAERELGERPINLALLVVSPAAGADVASQVPNAATVVAAAMPGGALAAVIFQVGG